MRPLETLPLGIDARVALLIDRLHGNLPLTEHPFAVVGAELGMDEDEVLDRLRRLLSQGVLTRLGPLYHIERAGGKFVLAALEVPEARYAEVTATVNAFPEVAHNYRREHAFNMWFVVATEAAAQCDAVLARIAEATGLDVHAFPKEREYYVGLRLPAAAGAGDG
jgi:DNA-binding Lrp family transcriptional regulator